MGETITGEDAGIIAQIAGMQAGETRTIDGRMVEAGQLYDAASGRMCKTITLKEAGNPTAGQTRLACQSGSSWFFVVDVFSSAGRTNRLLR